MDQVGGDGLAPPRDLRPAQLGVVLLGKVIAGHLGATLTDLAHRGFISLQELAGDEPQDWLVTDLRGQAGTSGALLPFETALLNGLFGGQAELHVQRLGRELIPVLNRVRRLIRSDARQHGWLQHLRPSRRTRRGEQLLAEIKTFRQQLRALAASGGLADRPDLQAYEIMLGLRTPPAEDPEPATRRDAHPRWRRFTAFNLAWLVACDGLSGTSSRNGHTGGFIHQWSTPASHSHVSHSPGSSGHGSSGHGSYGTDTYGGHGGGFGGGGGGHGH